MFFPLTLFARPCSRLGQPYDRVAIFTGSTTMVNGKPVIVYPGLCAKGEWKNCHTGTLFAVAIPANYSVGHALGELIALVVPWQVLLEI